MVLLTVTLLGGFEACPASGAPLRLPKKAQALLAYLGLRLGQGQSRDKLAALLWGDKDDAQARDGLRHALAALRRALGGQSSRILQVEGQTLTLDPGRVEVDVATFERLISEKAAPTLEQATALYRGDLLLGFNLNEPFFEEWLVTERERLRELAVDGFTRLLGEQTRAGTRERAIQTGVRLLALDHLQEGVHRALMRLYAQQGRRGSALRQYQICVTALRRELGTEPEAETRKLYSELLRRSTDAVPPVDGDDAGRRAPEARTAPPELPAVETLLVGRQSELEHLRRMLGGAAAGHGRVVTVLGEAGIGKTRLVDALAADAPSLGCRVLIGRCHESDSILPFGPWVDACRVGAVGADEEILDALHPTRRAELARLLPEAGRAGLPRASDSVLPLFESVAALVERLAAHRPLLLMLEDVHWADEMSLRLLGFVSRRVGSCPLLLVVTARDDELTEGGVARRTLDELTRASAPAIVLAPLSRADTLRLARALIRVRSDDPRLARVEAQVWAVSGGNPFVAVEIVRALDQQGLEPGWLADERPLPARVRDLVSRRLDRLSALGQELAAVAAVIGRRFDFALLASAGGVDQRDTAEAVEEMVRNRVLQAVGNELDFTHDRVRDVTYDRLFPHRRQVLHRAVAEALEHAGIGGEAIEQLAHHALRGDLREKAVGYLTQAGSRAAARSALQQARACFEQALAVLATLPENPSTLADAFEIRQGLRAVLGQLGEFRQALVLLSEAAAIAERLDDDGRRGRVYTSIASVQARLGDPDTAIVNAGRALEIAARRDDLRLRIPATSILGLAHYYRGEFVRVVELTTANLAALPTEWTGEFFGALLPASVNDRFRLVNAFAHLGRFVEAAAHTPEMIVLAERTGHTYTMGIAYHAASVLSLLKGDWTTALVFLERQIATLRAGNVVDELPTALAHSARALGYLGRHAEVLERIRESEQALARQPKIGTAGESPFASSLARAHLLLGHVDEAHRLARHALDSALGRLDIVPQALHLLGDVVTHPDSFDGKRGETCYREALALAEPRGMRPLIAHCHLGLGRLHQRAGPSTRAREHLATATATYRELGMDYWLAEAETVAI